MDQESFDAMYAEFVDCLLGTYVNQDPDSKAKDDVRDRKAKAFQKEDAFLWLESSNFAAVLSKGLGVKPGPEAAQIVDELTELTGSALIERIKALKEEDSLPLTASPKHPAEQALTVILTEEQLDREGERVGYVIYRDTAALLKRAKRDPEVREYIYAP